MSNLSDGERDGLALFYVKDKALYPVALTKEQAEMLDLMIGIPLGTLRVVSNKPIGKVISLKELEANKNE